MTDVGDHYRPTDGEYDPGIYRVVGATETVTLLRVTDGGGRRVHEGEVTSVPGDAFDAAFEPARDPDAGVSPVQTVRNALQGLYWSVRQFL